MKPGDGAGEQARRLAARNADPRTRTEARQRMQRDWEQGAAGERAVAATAAGLPWPHWRTMHDVHWPGRPFANLDHVFVGPTGIFVVDAKNWTGDVQVKDGVLRQNGYRRDKRTAQAAQGASAVAALLAPRHRRLVRAVVCLVGQEGMATTTNDGVTVVSLDRLLGFLSAGTPVLGQGDIETIADYLRRTLDGRRSPAQLTTAALTAPARATARRPVPVHVTRELLRTPVVPPGQMTPGDARRLLLFAGILMAAAAVSSAFPLPAPWW